MYQKPRLERFGAFRELTRIGFDSSGDGGLIIGRTVVGDGCDLYAPGVYGTSTCSR
jgi:hypothetical protein